MPRKIHDQMLIWRAAGPAAPTETIYITVAVVQSQLCWLPLAVDRKAVACATAPQTKPAAELRFSAAGFVLKVDNKKGWGLEKPEE